MCKCVREVGLISFFCSLHFLSLEASTLHSSASSITADNSGHHLALLTVHCGPVSHSLLCKIYLTHTLSMLKWRREESYSIVICALNLELWRIGLDYHLDFRISLFFILLLFVIEKKWRKTVHTMGNAIQPIYTSSF